jgi:PAS domain S-box-containing protein
LQKCFLPQGTIVAELRLRNHVFRLVDYSAKVNHSKIQNFQHPPVAMPSSVLKNVISPKGQNGPAARSEEAEHDLGPLNGTEKPAKTSSEGDLDLVLNALVENAPLAMALFDRQMRYQLANRRWVQEFGLQHLTPILGRSQYEVFPQLHPGWRQVYERALQGHIVRSEHDAGSSGMVYRWEVRPWRRQKDASVGGLMITCEKIAAGSSAESESSTTPDTLSAAKAEPSALDCDLPMLLVDQDGVIHHANAAASAETLDKGITEGKTLFWEVFGRAADGPVLRQQWQQSLQKLAEQPEESASLTTQRSEAAASYQWLISPHATSSAKTSSEAMIRLFTLVGLIPSQRPTIPVSPPEASPYPPAPEARVLMPAPVAPLRSEEETEKLQKLENEVARAKQELRTLMEAQRLHSEKEARLISYLAQAPCGLFVLDPQGRVLFQNARLAKLLGRPIQSGQNIEDWLTAACPTPEHAQQVTLAWRESVWRRQLTRTVSLATADGLLKEIEFQPCALESGALLISTLDVTESCRHEEQLRSLEAKVRCILQSVPVAVVLTDKTGVIFEVNALAESLLGQPKSELRRYPIDAWLEPGSAAARRDALRLLGSQNSGSEALGVCIQRPDGEQSSVILSLAAVPDMQGQPHAILHYLLPEPEIIEVPAVPAASYTESTSAVEETSSSEPTAAPSPLVTVRVDVDMLSCDANGRISAWSEPARELFDFDAETALGRPLHLLFRPSDATGFFLALAEQSAKADDYHEHACFGAQGRITLPLRVRSREEGGYTLIIQKEIACAEHATTHAEEPEASSEPAIPAHEASASSMPAKSSARLHHSPRAFQVVCPSSARWPVLNLDREKLMLSETHHRIKNHLQIISSLLNMQLSSVGDLQAREALRSSQNRVRAIASLHQHLHQLALGGVGTFSDFTRGLIEQLRLCYEAPESRVAVQLEIQDGPIDPEWLMPLALTLNEALSNSFEHAFPHHRHGIVHATLSYTADHGELTIQDDGIGLAAGFQPAESPGLGLKILAVFAQQMRGQLFIQNRPQQGSEIKLRFPIAPTA